MQTQTFQLQTNPSQTAHLNTYTSAANNSSNLCSYHRLFMILICSTSYLHGRNKHKLFLQVFPSQTGISSSCLLLHCPSAGSTVSRHFYLTLHTGKEGCYNKKTNTSESTAFINQIICFSYRKNSWILVESSVWRRNTQHENRRCIGWPKIPSTFSLYSRRKHVEKS